MALLGTILLNALVTLGLYAYVVAIIEEHTLRNWTASMSDEVWNTPKRKKRSFIHALVAFAIVFVSGVIEGMWLGKPFLSSLYLGMFCGYMAMFSIWGTALLAGMNAYIPIACATMCTMLCAIVAGNDGVSGAFGGFCLSSMIMSATCFAGTLSNEKQEQREWEAEDRADNARVSLQAYALANGSARKQPATTCDTTSRGAKLFVLDDYRKGSAPVAPQPGPGAA